MLLVHAPEPQRTVVRNAPAAVKATYVNLKANLREWQASCQMFTSGGARAGSDYSPMEIGAVTEQSYHRQG